MKKNELDLYFVKWKYNNTKNIIMLQLGIKISKFLIGIFMCI